MSVRSQNTPLLPLRAATSCALLFATLALGCGDTGGTSGSRSPATEDFDGDGEPDERATVIQAPVDVKRALCSNEYQSAVLDFDKITRGSWQFNPGGGFLDLPEPGYPCTAFMHDTMRPTPVDKRWTDAKDRDFVGFEETSTISSEGYLTAQFRYFRTLIFVPKNATLTSLSVKASGIDDALYLAVYNADNPEGTSPLDAGPSQEGVGACSGNGHAEWQLSKAIKKGQINMLLLVHADMSPSTSSLASVEILANGEPIQMVACGP
jgi:hypothetical protein